jgi:hypothetical protein
MFHRPRFFPWIYLGLVILIFCFALPVVAQSATPQSPAPAIGPIVRQSLHHDVSPALRDLPTISQSQLNAEEAQEAEPARRIPWSPTVKAPSQLESVVQSMAAAPSPEVAITVNQNFEGLGNGQFGFTVTGAPPDTNGAAGLTQYVQWVNTSLAVFDKSTGAVVGGPILGKQLWAGFGNSCETNNNGDPIVVYDKIANRWILSQFSVSGGPPFFQCIAVSTSSDATGTYFRYAFQYSNFDDYPKMGAWPDAYYVTFNMFNGSNQFVGPDLCAYDRNAMLNGQAASQICFQLGNSVGAVLPADFDGTTLPPNGSPNFMIEGDNTGINLFKFHVDFATPGNSTLSGPTNIPVAGFSPLCGGGTCVPQPGTTQQLDSLADRLMYRLAYRNFGSHESLVVDHSVVAGAGGGVRWYELQNPNGAVTVAQQSTFAPDSGFRWMGSIAMDKAGDIALGYSLSSSTVNPSIAVTGRTPSDPANTMQAENIMMGGTGQQVGNTSHGTPLTRWGDYSAMQIDPADDCTFWFTTEYMKTTGVFNWNTRIMSFKFPGCGAPPHVTGLSFNPSTVASGVSSTGTVTLDIAAPSPGATVALSSDQSIVQVPANVVVPTGQTLATFNTPTTPAPTTTVATVTASLNLTSQQGTLTVNASANPVLLVHRTGNILGTVTSGDGFINCGITCSAAYGSPNTVVLTATAAAGSTFTGWSGGGCSGTGTCSVTMNASQTVTASFVGGLGFVPIVPCRVVDTRNANGAFGGPFLSGQTSRGFTIPSGACSIPVTAQAYSLNVTVVPHTGLGFLTMYPCGQPVPGSSTLNSDGRVKAVGAIVPAGTSGAVCAFTTHDTELILDINGYFIPSTNAASLHFYPVTPCRLVDTRNAAGALGGPALVGQTTRTFPLRTACSLPPTVQAYSLNVTAVPTNGIGFLTAWPAGQTQPSASTLNAPAAPVAVANAAIVPAGTNGDVSVFTTHNTDLIIDVNGYFAAQSGSGLSLFTMTPCRIMDTRLPNGNPPLNGQLDVNVFASSCGPAATAKAYVLSATVVPPGLLGFLTLWPQGVTQPTASTLNSFDGVVYSNMAITPTANGYVSAFTSSPSHLILDISAYFAGVQTSAPTLQGPQTTTAAGVVAPNQPTAPAKDDK